MTKEQVFSELSQPAISPECPGRVESLVTTHPSPYTAATDAHAVVICTEWDEFVTLDYERIYKNMAKPAFIFDGRKILDHQNLMR